MNSASDPQRHLPLTPIALHVLMGLSSEPLNGYQLMARIVDNSRGRVRPGPGTLYERLHRMKVTGLVAEVQDSDAVDRRKQKFHTLSELGRAVLAAELERLEDDIALGRVALNARIER